ARLKPSSRTRIGKSRRSQACLEAPSRRFCDQPGRKAPFHPSDWDSGTAPKEAVMYDVYRHLHRSEFSLTVPQGNGLPSKARKGNWRLVAKRKIVPRIISDEIARSGFSISRPKGSTD